MSTSDPRTVSGVVCLACGSAKLQPWATATDLEYYSTRERFQYFRCGDCQTLSIDPIPSNRLPEIYPPTYYSFGRQVDESYTERIKQWLDGRFFRSVCRQITASRIRALDVGGGDGRELTLLKASEPRVSTTQVVDISQAAGELARRHGHSYFCGTFEEFSTEEQFDLVLLLNIIEHVARPGEVLAKVHEVLAPGGLAIIKTPNFDSLDARIFHHRNWGGYHCPRHWVLFTRSSFASLARRAGLKVVQARYTQGAPFWTTSVLFGLSHWGLVRITREHPVVTHPLFPLLNACFAAFDFARAPFVPTSQLFFVLRKD
jgi:2-polyprenyl-3-methyl-5-hydroxy-6-metoxy-1,4-benzoquinol methylase